jgi:hypothetical protein
MHELQWAAITVGTHIVAPMADGNVTAVGMGTVDITWDDEDFGTDTYTKQQFEGGGFTAYRV